LSKASCILIKSPWLYRRLEDSSCGLVTVEYSAPQHAGVSLAATPSAPEGRVKLDGVDYLLGGRGAQSLPLAEQNRQDLPDGGQRLILSFGSDGTLPDGITVSLVYEAPGSVSVLMKSIRIENKSAGLIRLDGIEVERITPQISREATLMLEDDYVRDAMTINGERVYSPWIEEHGRYIEAFLNTRAEETRFAYPVPINRTLSPGEKFDSFRVFEFIVNNRSEEERGLEYRRITRALFPWTRTRWLSSALPTSPCVEDYYRGIESAAEAGYEAVMLGHGWIKGVLTHPLFTNYNDYIPRPELFPNGWDGIRKLTDFAHSKGLKISCYTIYVNTWREPDDPPQVLHSRDWEMIWAADDNSIRWGPTLDPATGWGPFVNCKLEELISYGGFDSWHLDGPYYGDLCVAENRSILPGCNQVPAWERQVEFYRRMRALGLHGEAAQGFAAFAHGMSRITTTGYNEGDFGTLCMWEQIRVNRKAAYNFTKLYNPEQATTNIPVVQWSPDEHAPNMLPMEKHVAEYNAYLANVFGYGFEGKAYQRTAWDGPMSEAAVRRWLGFWKKYRSFFDEGYLLHIREPDGVAMDAIMHVLEQHGEYRALLVAYNPTLEYLTQELRLPFETAGWPDAGWVAISEGGDEARIRNGHIRVTVPPRNATWFELNEAPLNRLNQAASQSLYSMA
jgi:hypothetical protein